MIRLGKNQDIIIGKKYIMRSKILREERPYWVYLPNSYDKNNNKQRYPVLYLLDGDTYFHSASGLVQFMSSEQIPELVVVAIPNTDRVRDLTPTHTRIGFSGNEQDSLKSSGGADAFLKFFREELFPQVDSKFHTLSARILVGHSIGGLLAMHTLLDKPEMFQAYVAIDPSLWWDNEILTHKVKGKISAIRKLRKTAYISLANTSEPFVKDPNKSWRAIRKFVKALGAIRSVNFRLGFKYFGSEDHDTVPFLSLYHGLLYIFEGFKPAVIEDLPAMKARFKKISNRLGADLFPTEGYVNNVGYKMLYEVKDVKKAITIFENNVANFPKSANAHDSLGEAYMLKGDKAQAIKNYEKSFGLNSSNRNAVRMIRELKRKKETANT